MKNYIIDSLQKGFSLKANLLNNEAELANIEQVGFLLKERLSKGNKILLCGNGGSASDAQHIAAEFVGRFVSERRGLPAIALTTDTSILTAVGNDYGFETIFKRQVEALGAEGDILIGFSTSGNSANVVKALEAAQALGITTVGFLGGSGGVCKSLCDYCFVVDSSETARIQEMHITLGHILCGLVDNHFTTHD